MRWTVDLARRAEASVRLLAVHRPGAFDHVPAVGAFGTRPVSAELRARLQERLEAAAAGLADDIPVEVALLEGDPPETLSEQSEELDLLVLGPRGWGPLRSVLLGSGVPRAEGSK